MGPLTPILNNSEFPPGKHDTFLTDGPIPIWGQKTFSPETLFYPSGSGLMSNSDTFLTIPNHTQIFRDNARGLKYFAPTQNFNIIWSQPCTPSFSDHNPIFNIASSKWEKDLSINILEDDWEKIYSYIHKGTINVSAQENGFKLFSRWYNTPLRLHKISPTIPLNYWIYSAKDSSLLHIWWSCHLIQNFWRNPPPYCPNQNHYSILKKDYHHSLFLHLLNSANFFIPVHWKSPNPPTI